MRSGRRAPSPGGRQRFETTDGYRERKPFPGPVKRPRVETHSYQGPERRPFAKPAHKIAPGQLTPMPTCTYCGSTDHSLYMCGDLLKMSPMDRKKWAKRSGLCYKCLRLHLARDCGQRTWCKRCQSADHNTFICVTGMAPWDMEAPDRDEPVASTSGQEPKVTNAAVIEKKPVLFNPSPASVSDYPPLPQRKPVQKQPPKPVPQKSEPVKAAPVKTVPQKVEQVKTVPQKVEQVKTVPQKVTPIKTVPQKVAPTKTVPLKVAPVKTVPQKVAPVKTAPQQVEQAKTVPRKVAPVETVPQKVEQDKTVPQKVEQEKTVPQKVEPVKTAQKPTVVQKQEAKPAQKQQEAQNPEPKSAVENNDVKPAENKASGPGAAAAEQPAPGGRGRLGALSADALEDELHQIMDKVSEGLTQEPAADAERFVVGKLSSVAGDEIKNALGLNVTKRLLDQHNPLYVKLEFSGKPEAGCLQPFLAARRIQAFKRIAAPGDTFAARLDAVADFDSLCKAKEVTCGSAKVTVTPCYKFLACPSTLDTCYAPTNEEDREKTDNSEAKTAELDDKLPPKDDNRKEDNKTEVSQTNETLRKEAKIETTVKNTKVSSSPVTVNITIEAQSKSDGVKNTSKEVPKKKETAESVVNNKVTNQNDEVNKAKGAKDNGTAEMMVVDEHLDDDEEEMSGQDILALMSGGIVLDECSGSDDEK